MPADFREKALVAILGFLLTGVLGAMATTWIQQRGWTWQNRVSRIEQDTQNALAAYQSVSDLVNQRWHASFRVVQAIEHGADAEEWKAARDSFKLVWPLPCDSFALGKTVDATSARLIREVDNHCGSLVKDQIDLVSRFLSKDPPKLADADRKAFTDLAYKRLDALYHTNETLRCVIFIRALAMREELANSSYWESYFGLDAPNYRAPETKQCLS